MKQLTIEYLACYLPYGLKMTRNNFVGELLCIKMPKESSLVDYYEFQVSCSDWWETNVDDPNPYKPLLRPLSQLTQEILRCAGWTDHVDFCTHELKFCISKGYFPNNMPYEKMLWLFKNHYDVFGLIEQGLALPIQ